MTRWQGFSERLQGPADLLDKMRHDFDRMNAAPDDPFPAFDFFVAAEHIVDWRWPDDGAKRSKVRGHDPGKTVSHLANGAKHFRATAARHQSIERVSTDPHVGGVFDPAIFDNAVFDVGRPALVITMADGREVEATDLAALVLAYWSTELAPGGMHGPDDEGPDSDLRDQGDT